MSDEEQHFLFSRHNFGNPVMNGDRRVIDVARGGQSWGNNSLFLRINKTFSSL